MAVTSILLANGLQDFMPYLEVGAWAQMGATGCKWVHGAFRGAGGASSGLPASRAGSASAAPRPAPRPAACPPRLVNPNRRPPSPPPSPAFPTQDPNNPKTPEEQQIQENYNHAAVQIAFIAGCFYTGVGLLRMG